MIKYYVYIFCGKKMLYIIAFDIFALTAYNQTQGEQNEKNQDPHNTRVVIPYGNAHAHRTLSYGLHPRRWR
jgi:hypothetical protein